MHSQPAIREFAVRLDADVAAVKARCARAGVNPGVDIQALSGRESDRGGLLVAITERRTRADIDRLADVLGQRRVAAEREAVPRMIAETPQQRDRARTIFEKGAPGRRAFVCPELDVPEVDAETLLPARFRRAEPPRLPECSEPEIVRHYVSHLQAQLRPGLGLLPARVVHDEAQPAPARARSRAARGTPGCIRCRIPRARRGRWS